MSDRDMENRVTEADDSGRRTEKGVVRPVLAHRLSTRLLWLTMLFVMTAEVLIFVPSMANFREEWLRRKVETAAVAGFAAESEASGEGPLLAPEQGAGLLRALDAELVALQMDGAAHLLARAPTLSPIDLQIDLGEMGPASAIAQAFDSLLFGGHRTLRVFGPVGDGSMIAELVMSEAAVRSAMLVYARNIFFLSLAISVFTAFLVFLAINYLLIRPIRSMTRSMIGFGADPADSDRIIVPSGRRDEIGLAEAELAEMQGTLARMLREQRHLADLGLAVSKINHDLRNILSSAQLISDRLSDLEDPRVQRFAPMLIRSLDRALEYTRSVLSYGQAVERAPARRRVALHRLVEEIMGELAVPAQSGIELINAVEEELEVVVDPEQFYRVLVNLVRNAVQALEGEEEAAVVRRVRVEAERGSQGDMVIAVDDTGPGLPPRARENLFQAFRGSVRAGGTGLGLAIVAEIVEAHGGTIRLVERDAPGTRFEIRLPQRSSVSTSPRTPTDPAIERENTPAG
ncbi:sensor histidine kinase [Consotaella salsifontis]|uniref:histidine kinase n=1 Tax=Consotaella salsifontis TaxID=1365950 RepID=A0A1T4Q453_9HYPH|nr:HAMP domain-containing sensor histidine kinase [Consotaella salsifontis]SJZ98444.1 Signal transduction histidine kinase [Consotaella salsifontis]